MGHLLYLIFRCDEKFGKFADLITPRPFREGVVLSYHLWLTEEGQVGAPHVQIWTRRPADGGGQRGGAGRRRGTCGLTNSRCRGAWARGQRNFGAAFSVPILITLSVPLSFSLQILSHKNC